MKHVRIENRLCLALGAAVTLAVSGCDNLVLSNLLLGAREGALTTTTGIINGFFENRFGLDAAETSADESQQEEGGNDLFIHL